MIGPEDETRLLALLRGARAERERGLAELFERAQPQLFGLGLRITGHPDLAHDALQETYIDVARGVDGFRGDARLTTWLFRVAVRAATRVAARARSRTDTLPDELAGSGDDPSDTAEQRDSAARILAAIAALPATLRAVVALSALDGLAQTEVAEVLGIPPGTVYSRLHEARARLRAALANAASASRTNSA